MHAALCRFASARREAQLEPDVGSSGSLIDVGCKSFLVYAGTFWGADMHKKIPKGWREIREASGRVPDQCERCQQ